MAQREALEIVISAQDRASQTRLAAAMTADQARRIAHARTMARLAEIRQAEADAKAVSAPSAKTSGGRPPKGDVSRRAVAEKT
jgi:hypothetical protein